MRIVPGKTGSNLIEMLMEVPHCQEYCVFLSQSMNSNPKFSKSPGLWESAQKGLVSKVLSLN